MEAVSGLEGNGGGVETRVLGRLGVVGGERELDAWVVDDEPSGNVRVQILRLPQLIGHVSLGDEGRVLPEGTRPEGEGKRKE